jgi:methionine sulfoxide reductase heme-binding subunit
MQKFVNKWLWAPVHIAALIPLAILVWQGYQDLYNFTTYLTINPIQEITFRTGKYALVLLLLSLACTPVNTLFGIRQVLPLRKPLGLYAFMYASLHFLIFIGLDYGFDLELIYEAIFEKRYALVGFAAFLLLLPLAITSTRGWQKRLGKTWKRLHQLVYLAGGLVIIHFVWLVKSDIREPLAYGFVLALLLLVRAPGVRRQVVNFRNRLKRVRKNQAVADSV